MRARILLSVFAGGLMIALGGCGGDSREITPGAERADPAAPAAREEKLTPDDLRTGEGDVGATGQRSERPAGVVGEEGPVESGGAGTAKDTGEIVGRPEASKKPGRDR
jgi:hypothetical protein